MLTISLLPVQIILPWLTQSDKVHEQVRALGTISRLLRFICNFLTLLVSVGPVGPTYLLKGHLVERKALRVVPRRWMVRVPSPFLLMHLFCSCETEDLT